MTPGDARRKATMDTDMLRPFEWSVRALAQPAEVQLALYPSFTCHADELALEFEEAHRATFPLRNGAFSASQLLLIEELDRQLERMSGLANERLWTEEALREAPEWMRVRELAREVLEAMGWSSEAPPIERSAIYVTSDA